MPGTIQVSVLEFKGLSSPSPPSSLLIKVSMGKKEYQTWDKGNFSFPLTTLRDNLYVSLQDAEGNELSHTGVQSISIIEKGIWDDLFPLEGGGQVHMKLQFILSEDERNRIRGMRESALKKKQGEVLNSSLRYSETASRIGDSAAASLYINREVSDSKTIIIQKEASRAGDLAKGAGPSSNPGTSLEDSNSNNGKEGHILKQITPNSTDRSEESSTAPISSVVEVHHAPVEKIETQLPHADVPSTPIFPKDDTSMSESSKPIASVKSKSVLVKPEAVSADKTEKQIPPKKSPSNVRKMISAFETSLTQEKKPSITAVTSKSQTNRVGKEGPLKDQEAMHATKETESSSGWLKNPADLSSERLENPAADSVKIGDLVDSPTRWLENTAELSSQQLKNPADSSLGKEGPLKDQDSRHVTKEAESSLGRLTYSTESSSGMIENPEELSSARLMNARVTSTRGPKNPAELSFGRIENPAELSKGQLKNLSDLSMVKNLADSSSRRLTTPVQLISGRLKNPFLTGDMQQTPADIMETGEHIGSDNDGGIKPSHGTSQLESSAIKVQLEGADACIKSELISDHNEMEKGMDKSLEGLLRSSTSKPLSTLGETDEKTSSELQPSNFHAEQKDSDGTSVIEGGGKGINSIEMVEASKNKLKSAASHKNKQFNYESSGAWVFPHDTRQLCTTTGVPEVMDLFSGCQAEEMKSFSMVENAEKNELHCGMDAELRKSEDKSQAFGKSKPESSADDVSAGPIRQVIKMAVVVGFGILVLLTRQREPR